MAFPDKIKRLSDGKSKIQKEIKKKILNYLLAAFGLVAGLAWNDAIKTLIEFLFPLKQHDVLAKLLYAAIITAVIVVISAYIAKFLREEEA